MLSYKEIKDKEYALKKELEAIKSIIFDAIVDKVKNNGGIIALEKPIALDYIYHYNGCDNLNTDLVVQISEYKGTIIIESYDDEMSYEYRDGYSHSLHNYQIKSLNLLTLDELSKLWEGIKAV